MKARSAANIMMAAPDKTFPLWATIFTVFGVGVLCTLGTWQVQRLQWKTDLLAQLDALYEQAPQAMDSTAIAETATAQPDALFYPRVRVAGRLLADRSMIVGPRTHDGQNGYHLITPLRLDDGALLLVNRGFVNGPAAENAAPKTISGLLRRPEQPNMFVPANRPGDGRWYSIDPAAMATAQNLPAPLPLILYAEAENPPPPPAITPQDPRPALPNNHRDYAWFWFTMAGVLVTIYLIRFIRPRLQK